MFTFIPSPSTSRDLSPRQYSFGGNSALNIIVQELCESRGGRPGLSVLTSLLVSVDVKDPSHSAKSAGGRLHLNTHTPYLCGFE